MSPPGSAPVGPRRSGSAQARRPPARPAAVVSDEQILALVSAAHALGQRQRAGAHNGTAEANERLLRLDWAVRAGQLVLAQRAARVTTPVAGAAQRRRGDR